MCEFKERECVDGGLIVKLDNENQAAWACICTSGASPGFDTWLVPVRLRRDKVIHVANFACKHVEVGDLFVSAQCCNNQLQGCFAEKRQEDRSLHHAYMKFVNTN